MLGEGALSTKKIPAEEGKGVFGEGKKGVDCRKRGCSLIALCEIRAPEKKPLYIGGEADAKKE